MILFAEKVYSACRRIRKGRVSTYSEIAKAIGSPYAQRAIGNALNRNPHRSVPCHRVVCSDGRVGGFARGPDEKAKMLVSEGLGIEDGRIIDFRGRLQRL